MRACVHVCMHACVRACADLGVRRARKGHLLVTKLNCANGVEPVYDVLVREEDTGGLWEQPTMR